MHLNIIKLYGVTVQPQVTAVMELACVNLNDFVDLGDGNHCVYNLRQLLTQLEDYGATDYFLQTHAFHINAARDIACGLQYLHEKNIAHRDMKPGNVLVSSDQDHKITCKLTDFGEARALAIHTASIHTRTAMLDRGTVVYSAPELLLHTLSDLQRADVWAYGMTVFSLLNPGLPYPWKNEMMGNTSRFKDIVITRMLKKDLPSHSVAALPLSKLHEMFKICCQYEPSDRPHMTSVMELWVSEG